MEKTTCVIVGGGPAGLVLTYLLARAGIKVALLEAHGDFDRAFRGDTVHPATLELFDQLGLIDKLLALPHSKMQKMRGDLAGESFVMGDFSSLKTKYPYVMLLPQVKLLDLLAHEIAAFPHASIRMGTAARRLLWEGSQCVGVGYQSSAGAGELRADLVIACDGRSSILRREAKLEPINSAPPMDILWFNLSRKPGDPPHGEAFFYFQPGTLALAFDRTDHWQAAYVIAKGGFHRLKQEGIESFQKRLGVALPMFADRASEISDWTKMAVLDVASNRLPVWHKPGLLLIGDAAHTMSPVGGVGINYAIQDAVEVYNHLLQPLRDGTVKEEHLAAVQKRREWPVKFIQFIQAQVQKRFVAEAMDPNKKFRPPWPMRLGLTRGLMARVIGYGIRPSRLTAPI